jgi:molybdopterin-biosynthesis enzyme MoeA-like protein
MPRGAELIDNPVSVAPGFSIGNVHVLAGVPRIMQAMFEALAPRLAGGPPIVSRAVHAQDVFEGRIADGLGAIQAAHAGLDLGSYPYYRGTGNGVAIVAKGPDPAEAEAAIAEVTALLRALGSTPVQGEPPV